MKPAVKRWLGPVVLAVVLAIITCGVVVYAMPRVLMSGAIHKLGSHGINKWLGAPRVTPNYRFVVRPSPELAYSACIYDLRQGPVHIRVQPMPGYWSLSLFDAATDNYRVWDDRTAPKGVDIWLAHGGTAGTAPSNGAMVVESPSARGIALIRRRVTSDAAWASIQQTRKGDRCRAVR